ncbi:MAG: SCP2 sterol-binding domain-containing protein [Candidatus Binatia bacterium]
MAMEFLSDEWFAEAKKIRDEVSPPAPTGPAADLTLNIVVTGGPSGDKEIHIKAGEFGEGLVEAPTKLTVPYEVAKKTFIERDQQAGMQAFMQGQIKVEGDMSKLMAMQTVQPSAEEQEVQKRIADITA